MAHAGEAIQLPTFGSSENNIIYLALAAGDSFVGNGWLLVSNPSPRKVPERLKWKKSAKRYVTVPLPICGSKSRP